MIIKWSESDRSASSVNSDCCAKVTDELEEKFHVRVSSATTSREKNIISLIIGIKGSTES